jgi:hypothetical protein
MTKAPRRRAKSQGAGNWGLERKVSAGAPNYDDKPPDSLSLQEK